MAGSVHDFLREVADSIRRFQIFFKRLSHMTNRAYASFTDSWFNNFYFNIFICNINHMVTSLEKFLYKIFLLTSRLPYAKLYINKKEFCHKLGEVSKCVS